MTDDELTPEERAVIERLRVHRDQGQLSPQLADRLHELAPSAQRRRRSWLPAVGVAVAIAVAVAVVWGSSTRGASGRPADRTAAASTTSSTAPGPEMFPVTIDLPTTDAPPPPTSGVIDARGLPQPMTLVGSASRRCVYVIDHKGEKRNLVFPRGYTARFTSETNFIVTDENGALYLRSDQQGMYYDGIIPANQVAQYGVCLPSVPAFIAAAPWR